MLRTTLIVGILLTSTLMALSFWVKLESPPVPTLPERHREFQNEAEPEVQVPSGFGH